MSNNVGSALSTLLTSGRTFYAPFADKGGGEVSLIASGAGASQAATFTRATTATTVNSAGLIVSVASGVARSYYDPTTLSYLGYLSEGARTNLCLQSQDFSNAKWLVSNSTVTANNIAAPDGTTTGNKILETVAVGTHQVIYDNAVPVTISAATVYTLSIFAKGGLGRDWFRLGDGTGNLPGSAYFNLTTGAVGTVTSGTATIKAYPNGWYRCTVTSTSAGTTCRPQIATADSDGNVSYAGDITKGIYAWGADLEAGAFASTYIPTTTASVTRNADVLTYPSSGNVGAIGSMYIESSGALVDGVILATGPVSAGNYSTLSPRGTYGWFASASAGSATLGANNKVSVGFNGTAFTLVTNAGSATSGTSDYTGAAVTTIGVGCRTDGTQQTFCCVRNVRIYQTQLSASQLQAVTA